MLFPLRLSLRLRIGHRDLPDQCNPRSLVGCSRVTAGPCSPAVPGRMLRFWGGGVCSLPSEYPSSALITVCFLVSRSVRNIARTLNSRSAELHDRSPDRMPGYGRGRLRCRPAPAEQQPGSGRGQRCPRPAPGTRARPSPAPLAARPDTRTRSRPLLAQSDLAVSAFP